MCISWFVLEASYDKISKERTETMFRNSKAGEGSSEGACNSGMPDPSLRWTRWKACQQRSKHPLENWVVGSLGNTHCVLKISHASFHISQESWEVGVTLPAYTKEKVLCRSSQRGGDCEVEGRALWLCSPGAFPAGQWNSFSPGKNQAWLLVAQGTHILGYISWAVFQFSLRPFHKGVNSHPKASPHIGTDCVVTASFPTASLSSNPSKNLCSARHSSGGTGITPLPPKWTS